MVEKRIGSVHPDVLETEKDQHPQDPAPGSGFAGGGEKPPGRPTAVGADGGNRPERHDQERTPSNSQKFINLWTKMFLMGVSNQGLEIRLKAIQETDELLEKVLKESIITKYGQDYARKIARVALLAGTAPSQVFPVAWFHPEQMFDKSAGLARAESSLLDHFMAHPEFSLDQDSSTRDRISNLWYQEYRSRGEEIKSA